MSRTLSADFQVAQCLWSLPTHDGERTSGRPIHLVQGVSLKPGLVTCMISASSQTSHPKSDDIDTGSKIMGLSPTPIGKIYQEGHIDRVS